MGLYSLNLTELLKTTTEDWWIGKEKTEEGETETVKENSRGNWEENSLETLEASSFARGPSGGHTVPEETEKKQSRNFGRSFWQIHKENSTGEL